MTSAPNCVFCAIEAGDAPASFVWQDELVVGFMDINPVTPGHLLVMPRRHLPALGDLDDLVAARMFEVARTLAATLRKTGWRVEGINPFYADGQAANQEVFHSHLHVFPRFEGDGFGIAARWDSRPDREELDTQAAQIRDLLAAADDTGP